MHADHIFLFSAYYSPHLGGVETYTECLAKELCELGHRVTVVTSSSNGTANLRGDATQSDVAIVTVPSISIMGDRFPLIIPNVNLLKTLTGLKEARPTKIVINTRYYPLSLLGCALAKTLDIKPVVIDHSSGPLSNGTTYVDKAFRFYERIMTAMVNRYSPLYCSVSKKGADWLRNIGLVPSGVVHNSIDAEEFRRVATQRNWRKELNCSESSMLVVYAGRLIESKGVLMVVEAVKSLTQEMSNIKLAIAGSGELSERIEPLQDNNIVQVGKLDRSDLSALLRDADCLCLPTRYPEGLPTVLLEAASQHAAIIVSDCAGAREVVPSTNEGIVLDRIDTDGITHALRFLADNPHVRHRIALTAAKHVESAFSWETAAQSLMSVLSEI